MIGRTHFRNIHAIETLPSFHLMAVTQLDFDHGYSPKSIMNLTNEYQKDIIHHVRAYVFTCKNMCLSMCDVYTARKQETRDGTREAQDQTRSRGSTRGQPSTSNSNQRRQTRCVNMTCLLRETWEVSLSTAYVAVRTAKEAFTTTRRGSPFCNSRQRLPLPDSSALPSLRKQEISWFLRDEPIKLRSSINTFISG